MSPFPSLSTVSMSGLHIVCSCCHSLWEFICASVLLCLEDTVLLESSEPCEEALIKNILFRTGYYSNCFLPIVDVLLGYWHLSPKLLFFSFSTLFSILNISGILHTYSHIKIFPDPLSHITKQ